MLEWRNGADISVWADDNDRAFRWADTVRGVPPSATVASHVFVVEQDPRSARQYTYIVEELGSESLTSTSAT